MDPRDSYALALQGDFRSALAFLEHAKLDDPWRAILRAECALAGLASPEPIDWPASPELRTHLAESTARVAVLRRDATLLRQCADAHPTGLPQGWHALLFGNVGEVKNALTDAARSPRPAVRIEAASLAAFAHARTGNLRDATAAARRASRMARTEGLPQSQYIANLALAHVRRLAGQPSLALRILAGLARVVPPLWQPWIAWETALSGRAPAADDEISRAWNAIFEQRADNAWPALQRVAAAWPMYEGSLRPVRAAFDVTVPPPPSIADFLSGRSNEVPPLLAGFFISPDGSSRDTPRAYLVINRADVRRVAVHAKASLAHLPCVEATDRVALALSVFATTRSGRREAIFRAIYGFPFDPDLHVGVLHTLLYRARQALGDVGEIVTGPEEWRLNVHKVCYLADAQCEESLEERMMRFLARAERKSAKEASSSLGISLRSAQETLARLVHEGAVASQKSGRRVAYRVEDTTFQEPTGWGSSNAPR
ncbi:MAG: helix-turn-helix transcriptional regulator [Myxococcota bacterium]